MTDKDLSTTVEIFTKITYFNTRLQTSKANYFIFLYSYYFFFSLSLYIKNDSTIQRLFLLNYSILKNTMVILILTCQKHCL